VDASRNQAIISYTRAAYESPLYSKKLFPNNDVAGSFYFSIVLMFPEQLARVEVKVTAKKKTFLPSSFHIEVSSEAFLLVLGLTLILRK